MKFKKALKVLKHGGWVCLPFKDVTVRLDRYACLVDANGEYVADKLIERAKNERY